MQRLAGVRVWSYIAARPDWVRNAAHWQARAREVEDLLSDALHERLTTRFVDRRAAHLMRRLEAGDGQELLSAVTRRGEVVVEGHPVGHVGGFTFFPDPGAVGEETQAGHARRPARAAGGNAAPRAAAETAPDDAFTLTNDHAISGTGRRSPASARRHRPAAARRDAGQRIPRRRPARAAARPPAAPRG